MKLVFIDDDWGRGGKNDWLVAPEESAKGQGVGKRGGLGMPVMDTEGNTYDFP